MPHPSLAASLYQCKLYSVFSDSTFPDGGKHSSLTPLLDDFAGVDIYGTRVSRLCHTRVLASESKYSACYSATKVRCSLVRTAALLLWPMVGTLRSAQAQQWLY